MRRIMIATAAVAVLGTSVLAQGAQDQQTIAQQMRDQLNVGPAFAQQDFLGNPKKKLTESFGEKRGKELFGNLQKSGGGLDASEVTDLMNGKATTSGLQDLFRCHRSETEGVEQALQGAVGEKNRDLFFGMMIQKMTGGEHAMDPNSEEFKHICGCRDSMDDEDFEKLRRGSVSTKTISEAFDVSDKDLRKLLQRILNALREMEAVDHPMCASLGMGDTNRFSPDRMPPMRQGMPGSGPQFANGMAGGMPFDAQMPPLPFMGGNLQGMPGCEPPPCPPPPCKPGEGGGPPPTPAPPEGGPQPRPEPDRPGAPPRRPDDGEQN